MKGSVNNAASIACGHVLFMTAKIAATIVSNLSSVMIGQPMTAHVALPIELATLNLHQRQHHQR
jgi:uncharacterized membrane protein